jgi:hypothetical protein
MPCCGDWVLVYGAAAMLTALFFMMSVCGHCFGLDTRASFYGNALFNAALWPLALLSFIFVGRPLITHLFDDKNSRIHSSEAKAAMLKGTQSDMCDLAEDTEDDEEEDDDREEEEEKKPSSEATVIGTPATSTPSALDAGVAVDAGVVAATTKRAVEVEAPH